MSTFDTIVIGMGAAGVAAAATLARAGRSVLGLEAAERVGGRVKTVPFAGGLVELGAEWIHGTEDSRVYELATANNVTVLPQDVVFRAYRSDGTDGDTPLANELINYCLALTERPPQTPEPLGQFITRECRAYVARVHPQILQEDANYLPAFLAFMSLFVDNYEASNDWSDVTTSSRYEELPGHQHMSWHRHGYCTLFDILLNKYGDGTGLPLLTVECNKEVTRVAVPTRPQQLVAVTCADGAQYTARSAIVTVSLGVLKERHATLFSPALPLQKVEAIERISIGVMDKVILSFERAWWPRDATFFGFIWRPEERSQLAAEDAWCTRIFGASNPKGAPNALTLWTSGDVGKMVETLPEDAVKRTLMELLRRFMGNDTVIPEPTGLIRSTWYSNPFTRGSYTFDNLDRPQYPDARRHLAAPLNDSADQPRVLFAGEATNEVHYSTVHGAVETGLREANRLLEVKSKI